MDAKNILIEVAEAFAHIGLEAVMIGNSAAAIQGAPVTTMDIYFCVRDSDDTIKKLRKIAKHLDAKFLNYGTFFQIQAPGKELYLDFLINVLGVKSFDCLMKKSSKVSFDRIYNLNIACLKDIIRSKKLAGQDKDKAVLPILVKTLKIKNEEKKKTQAKTIAGKAGKVSDSAKMELSMILSRLSMPMEKRTGFLRKRLANGGSCL
ncbi:MAG TPA: hypothetical protein PK821_08760 [Victivallales bacterium]|nr:hypothetical protein [Victivallales bacterium]